MTLVTSRVDSVTSTCLRSSFGDIRTISSPIVPVSSGAGPGQTSTTIGLSAPAAGPATHIPRTSNAIDVKCMIE